MVRVLNSTIKTVLFGLMAISIFTLNTSASHFSVSQANAEDERAPTDDENLPTLVNVPLTNAFIPAGFDSNDRTQVVVEGFFRNSCYRLGPSEKTLDLDTGSVKITQKAYKYKGPCLMMIVPFSETVKIGLLAAKEYTIMDGESGRDLGKLPVKAATNNGPDDYVYSIVRNFSVVKTEDNKNKLILQGELPGSCWSVKEIKVIPDGVNVLTILPIIDKTREENCADSRVPYVEPLILDAGFTGRYLIQARSLNGDAINQLVDL